MTTEIEPRAKANYLLEECFRSSKPGLAFLPHCIFKKSREALTEVLAVCKVAGGIFGNYPSYDRKGKIYISPTGNDTDEFSLWEIPGNQEKVLNYGAIGKLEDFTAIIDSRTPKEVLASMHAELNNVDAQHFNYSWWIESIANWVPRLGWAYIPLSDETAFAIFAAKEAPIVSAVESRLVALELHPFTLIIQDHKVSWPIEFVDSDKA